MTELNKDKAQGKAASFGSAMKTVFWSFLGIRKHSDHEQETAKLNPVYVVIAGLLGVAIFITVLLIIVKSVLAK
jgi:preprotein translocase subunit Sec61beta